MVWCASRRTSTGEADQPQKTLHQLIRTTIQRCRASDFYFSWLPYTFQIKYYPFCSVFKVEDVSILLAQSLIVRRLSAGYSVHLMTSYKTAAVIWPKVWSVRHNVTRQYQRQVSAASRWRGLVLLCCRALGVWQPDLTHKSNLLGVDLIFVQSSIRSQVVKDIAFPFCETILIIPRRGDI